MCASLYVSLYAFVWAKISEPGSELSMLFQYEFSRSTVLVLWTCLLVSLPTWREVIWNGFNYTTGNYIVLIAPYHSPMLCISGIIILNEILLKLHYCAIVRVWMGGADFSRSLDDWQVGGGLHMGSKYSVFHRFLGVLSMFRVFSHNDWRIFLRHTTRMGIF